jgi:hypothetical protein
MPRNLAFGERRSLRPILATLIIAASVAALGLGPTADPSAGPTTGPVGSAGSSLPADASGSAGSPIPSGPPASPPVLAYYYMWFNTASWSHAKADLPALGSYTSTNPAIIRQQVTWARQSGVDAFIVSWKSTPSLNLGLQELVDEVNRQGLKLVLIYEGLDVNRNPIAADTVLADLVWFEKTYGQNPAFDLYGKPAIIWSGTWRFGDADIARVRTAIDAPNQVMLLGSEKSQQAYDPRAALFDGDAYYWSSADPLSTPGYAARLKALSQSVHSAGGLWLAPTPVGFDARLNGGTSVVDRRDGGTLAAAWAAALGSAPDGLAVISWNEYTEGSYIEPSVKYGFRYLAALSSLTGAGGPKSTTIPSIGTGNSPAGGDETVGGQTAAGSATDAGAVGSSGVGGGRGGAPARPQPIDDAPFGLAFAAVVLLVLVLLGLRLRMSWRRSYAGRQE